MTSPSVDGTSTTFDLGLPGSDPTAADGDDGPESDGESGDADSDADGAAGSVRSKGSNKAPRIPDMGQRARVRGPVFLHGSININIHIITYISLDPKPCLKCPSNAFWPRPSKMYPLS